MGTPLEGVCINLNFFSGLFLSSMGPAILRGGYGKSFYAGATGSKPADDNPSTGLQLKPR